MTPAFALHGASKRYEAFTLHPLDLCLEEGQTQAEVAGLLEQRTLRDVR